MADTFEEWLKQCGVQTDEEALEFLNRAANITAELDKKNGVIASQQQVLHRVRNRVAGKIADKILLEDDDDL